MGKKALEGIMVLDLSRVLAAPYCAMLLADHGANVIKIERAGSGDDTRESVPKLGGESAYYMCLNRNKRGVTLNLKSLEGKKMFLDMVKQADVVLENYRPGVMEKLGLGYDVLKQTNPGVIYAAISGFGHTGPYSQRAGFDIVGQAMSGLMACTGWPGGPPTRAGAPLADTIGGINCAFGIMAALRHRDKTGEGQMVDVALVDSMVSSLITINMLWLAGNHLPERLGNQYENAYPYDSFRASDGEFVMAAPYDAQWSKLCACMNRPEYIDHPKMNCEEQRIKNCTLVKELIEQWSTQYTKQENAEILEANGIACAPIYTMREVASDPHIAGAREMFVSVDHPLAGISKITNNAVRLTGTPSSIERPAPTLGQHNEEVYGEMLNLSKQTLEVLSQQGVI